MLRSQGGVPLKGLWGPGLLLFRPGPQGDHLAMDLSKTQKQWHRSRTVAPTESPSPVPLSVDPLSVRIVTGADEHRSQGQLRRKD